MVSLADTHEISSSKSLSFTSSCTMWILGPSKSRERHQQHHFSFELSTILDSLPDRKPGTRLSNVNSHSSRLIHRFAYGHFFKFKFFDFCASECSTFSNCAASIALHSSQTKTDIKCSCIGERMLNKYQCKNMRRISCQSSLQYATYPVNTARFQAVQTWTSVTVQPTHKCRNSEGSDTSIQRVGLAKLA